MGPLLKHGDRLKMQKTLDTELKAGTLVPEKEREKEAKYSLVPLPFSFSSWEVPKAGLGTCIFSATA